MGFAERNVAQRLAVHAGCLLIGWSHVWFVWPWRYFWFSAGIICLDTWLCRLYLLHELFLFVLLGLDMKTTFSIDLIKDFWQVYCELRLNQLKSNLTVYFHACDVHLNSCSIKQSTMPLTKSNYPNLHDPPTKRINKTLCFTSTFMLYRAHRVKVKVLSWFNFGTSVILIQRFVHCHNVAHHESALKIFSSSALNIDQNSPDYELSDKYI